MMISRCRAKRKW
uniref:Uncharacterized protein n=1 Tax=Rhizophora mucronata TaxID=61149 RepID=A0A2P2PEK3_RHIMU